MTLQELFALMTKNPFPITIFFICLPIAALVLNWIAKGVADESPWKYVYSVLIYLVCVPATFSVILCFYSMFFQRSSLLNVNALIYFLPIISGIASITIASKQADIDSLPGFKKLSALVMLMAVTFIAMLFIEKTRILVVFFGSMSSLLVLFGVLLLIFSFAWYRLTRS